MYVVKVQILRLHKCAISAYNLDKSGDNIIR
jgi:hypothetical protein